jgi:hypothetical protein
MLRWLKIKWHLWSLWDASYYINFQKYNHHWNALRNLGLEPEEIRRLSR